MYLRLLSKSFKINRMVQVKILGPAEIRKADGQLEQSFLTGPKRLALLVYLLLKQPFGFHRRDSLLPLFWPEMGQRNARNSLSNILYHIRKTFGNEAVINRGGEEIQINQELFECDVVIFETYLKENRIDDALALYRGDLLKGFYVSQTSVEFEFWLEKERHRLRDKAGSVVSNHIKSRIVSGNTSDLLVYTRKSMELNLPEENECLDWLESLYSIGENQMAQNIYREFCQNYSAEYEEEPSSAFDLKIKEIRNSIAPKNGKALHGKVPENNGKLNRIAVLPFESYGKENDPALTEALHSDILTKLSELSGLHVISRTSVLGYRGTHDTAPEIATRLKIDWILTGEVMEMANNIKVNVRLINAGEDRQIWAETYLKHLNVNNIFKIQGEITSKITNSLRIKLSQNEKHKIKDVPADNLESYCLQAQARWHFDQRTEKGLNKAIELFREAIKMDSNYALAWVGLADSLLLLQDYGYAKPNHDEVIKEAEVAANKALEIDPELAEVHATLGLLLGARREGQRALDKLKEATERRPGYSDAYNWMGWFYNVIGDQESALHNSIIAVELNPLSPEALSNLALAHLISGEYETAIRQSRQIQILNPEWTTSYFYEGLCLYGMEQLDEAETVLKNLMVDWAGNAVENILALIWFKRGEKVRFSKMQEKFQLSKDYFGGALLYAVRNEPDRSLEDLQKIEEWNYWNSIALLSLFKEEFKCLEDDPEFKKIKDKARLFWGA